MACLSLEKCAHLVFISFGINHDSHVDWKTWQMGKHFPARKKSGNFEKTGKWGNFIQNSFYFYLFLWFLIEVYLFDRFLHLLDSLNKYTEKYWKWKLILEKVREIGQSEESRNHDKCSNNVMRPKGDHVIEWNTDVEGFNCLKQWLPELTKIRPPSFQIKSIFCTSCVGVQFDLRALFILLPRKSKFCVPSYCFVGSE